ncbi:CLUMA_CG004381, isoform A [Clunio marinus]|uniref:CLUMA_CG004381, isoform A n=1 Tax=Clunio marinus TaxID=568069 RepID=A0A1J1HRH8_9DIPT|nr:CLUMA_CG004381, isoform A [Clunio marinus]
MEEKLLHPYLLQNNELIMLIKERELNISNLEQLERTELMDVYRKHIMPKPQRRQKQEKKSVESNGETVLLVNEVKKIKLNRLNSQELSMDCTTNDKANNAQCINDKKRLLPDSNQKNTNKRQRIQWP